MVNTVLGNAQQPFATLYQPGGAAKGDSRVSTDPGARAKSREPVENKRLSETETDASEKYEKSEEKTASSYNKDSSCSSGNCQRGQLVNITA